MFTYNLHIEPAKKELAQTKAVKPTHTLVSSPTPALYAVLSTHGESATPDGEPSHILHLQAGRQAQYDVGVVVVLQHLGGTAAEIKSTEPIVSKPRNSYTRVYFSSAFFSLSVPH